ncbi:polysaccharide biosynthesis C-terminal domain-containing protein [bacterium]|nr:polysaccharide biosynthesis C-terminal domain-containing protein [bacterium]
MLVLSFFNNKLIYIFLDKSDNGIYFIFMRFSMFISLIFSEWFRLSNVNIAGGDRNLIPVLSANNLWYSISVGLLMIGAAFALAPVTDRFVPGMPWRYILAAGVVGSLVILKESSQSILMVTQRMYRYGITFVVWFSAVLGLNILFLMILKRGLDFVVAAWFLGILAGTLWAYFSVVSFAGINLKPSWNVFTMSGKIGARAWLAALGMFVMINIHTFTIGPLLNKTGQGLAMIAIFSVCFRVFQLLQRVSNVSGTILFSHIVQQEKLAGLRMTMLVSRNIIFFSVISCIIGMVMGKGIILLIANSTYLMAYVPLLLMLPGIVAINAGSVINNLYWGQGYPYHVILAPFWVAVVGIALDVVLIPVYGVSGATLSFTLMGVVWFGYMLYLFRKDSGYRLDEILLPRKEDFTLLWTRFRVKFSGGGR